MRGLSWSILFAVVGILSSASAQSQAQLPTVRAVLALAVRPDADLSAPGRMRFGKALSAFCREVSAALPTNTPREADWVSAETNTADGDRLGRLVRTPEYSRFRLASDFAECLEKTAKLEAAQAARSLKDEAFWFASLSATFNNDRDIALHARQANVSVEKLGIDWISTIRYRITIAALRAIENLP